MARAGSRLPAELLVPAKPDVDIAGLRAEAKAIRGNLNELAEDKALGLIDRAQLLSATAKANARLAAIDSEFHAAVVESPLRPQIEAEDPRAVWESLPLSHKRLIIARLITVCILPSGCRGRGFDPDTVEIRWNDKAVEPGRSMS